MGKAGTPGPSWGQEEASLGCQRPKCSEEAHRNQRIISISVCSDLSPSRAMELSHSNWPRSSAQFLPRSFKFTIPAKVLFLEASFGAFSETSIASTSNYIPPTMACRFLCRPFSFKWTGHKLKTFQDAINFGFQIDLLDARVPQNDTKTRDVELLFSPCLVVRPFQYWTHVWLYISIALCNMYSH